MKNIIAITFICFLGFYQTNAQGTQEYWETYIASYEDDKPGSTTVRMDLIETTPMTDFSHVVITGIQYATTRPDGFPEKETFSLLHAVGDALIAFVQNETKTVHVGSFMFEKERLEYMYVKDADGLKEKLDSFYSVNYPDHKYYLNVKEDKDWKAYREFLYPNEEIMNYLADQAVVVQLLDAGDDLSKERKVDHWLYFATKEDLKKCEATLTKKGFSIGSTKKTDNKDFPFQLQISRTDFVDLGNIYGITSDLRKTVSAFNGIYDGWETIIIKE